MDDDGNPLDTEGAGDAPLEDASLDVGDLADTGDQGDAEGADAGDGGEPVGDGEALAAVRHESAASRRIQQEIARRKQLEKENNEYRQHILNMQRRDAVTKPITEDPEEERRRLEFMDEPQRVQYLVDKGIRSYQADVHRLELQMNINSDKIGFSSFIAANPHLKKYADDVETEFNQALQKGQPKSRADILTSLIGHEVIKKGSAALKTAKQAGQDNIRRQQTRPSNTRSGVTGTGKRSETAEETLKRRLAQGEYT